MNSIIRNKSVQKSQNRIPYNKFSTRLIDLGQIMIPSSKNINSGKNEYNKIVNKT